MGAKILKNLTNEELKKVEADLVLLLQRHRAEQSCWEFFKQAWHVLEPFDYEYNWHHEYFCELFQALVESPNKEKLLINIPPRHLKSLIFSVVGPAWVWTSRPHLSFICSSFSGNLSTSLSIKRRDLIQSSWYQTRWGSRFTIKDDQNTKEKFKNDKNGQQYAVSVGGSGTGEGCDILINDDPQNPKKAYSDAEREQANRHHKDTLQSRFNDKRRSKQIVVQQRLHANDLTGALKDAGYKQIIIPVQNVTKKPLTYIFPISGKKVVIKPGAYLSERFTEAEVIETKKDMSADQYNAQYLQSPQAPGGAIVKSKHIRHWISEPKVEDSWQFVHSIDCTFKGEGQGKKPDYVALQTWAFKGSQKLLVRRAKGKWGITQTIKMMCDFVLNCPEYVAFLIEDKANGPAILELIGKSVERLIPINPKDSKIERLVSIVPDIEAGNVLLPPLEANPWLEKEYIPELVGFPNVSHDDEVDCTTQAVSYIKNITKGNIEDLVTGLNGLFG